MRICLITEEYPAAEQSDAASRYITKLAKGLAAKSHQVTVVCASNKTGAVVEDGINVHEVTQSKRLSNLSLAPQLMPESKQFANTQLNYWHAFSDVMKDSEFDVVETTLPLAATLLSALTRETATVVRIEEEFSNDENNFDAIFQNLIVGYALSCVDVYSAPQSHMTKIDSERICINSEINAAELASRAMQIYEIAVERYKNVDRPDLYRHGSERLIKSTEDMMVLYDQMLYDLLFRVSYRFRIMHWWRSLRSNPQNFTAKLRQKLSSRP